MSMNIETLKKIGGKEWKKDGMHRVYFNNLEECYGLSTSQYKTGNISRASLDGESISNSQARRICSVLAEAKVWYDLTDQKFHGRGPNGPKVKFAGMFPAIVDAIKARIAEVEKPLPQTKSEIFKAAHAAAKAGTEGTYRARFSTALKAIYAAKKI